MKKAQIKRWLRFGGVAATLAVSAVAVCLTWPRPAVSPDSSASYPHELRMLYSQMVRNVHDFEARQDRLHAKVVSRSELDRQLSLVQVDAASGHFVEAKADLMSLKQALANWNFELSGGTDATAALPNGGGTSGLHIPILLYHYPPPNFEQQLEHLEQAGYTTIDLDQVVAALHGDALPAKPVVITYDDGFAAQMSAFEALKRHQMKATFYIIVGGPESKWCIGSGRRYGDALQPPGGCGDSYLNWDQVREMDRSGLITIGGHTINHRNLASLSEVDQRYEIATGKEQLEAHIGHSIRHLAYPYGAYNATSIMVAQEAGYLTAVTTLTGEYQPAGSAFVLRRVRDAMVLP